MPFGRVKFTEVPVSVMGEKNFTYFTSEVEKLETAVSKIRQDVDDLKRLHAEALQSATVNTDALTRRETLTAGIANNSRQIRADLALREAQLIKSSDLSQTEKRMVLNKLTNLKQRFADLLAAYEEDQNAYKERIERRIRKQIEIAGGAVSEQQMEEIIQSGGQSVFTQGAGKTGQGQMFQILSDTQVAKQTMSDMQSRAKEVLNLERDMRELHELCVHLAVMVDEQDATVDNIQVNVENAAAAVDQGAGQVSGALKNARAARKKKVLLAILGVIVVLIVILVIYLSLQ